MDPRSIMTQFAPSQVLVRDEAVAGFKLVADPIPH